MADDILREIREIRDAYAAQFNYDLRAMHADLLEKQRSSGRTYVTFPPRRPAVVAKRDACDE